MLGVRLRRSISRLQLRAEAINGLNRLADLRMNIHRRVSRPTQWPIHWFGFQLQVRVK